MIGVDIPEYNITLDDLECVFKIIKVFEEETYKGDSFCRGFIFSHECSKLILKFGHVQMESSKKKASQAKKLARA